MADIHLAYLIRVRIWMIIQPTSVVNDIVPIASLFVLIIVRFFFRAITMTKGNNYMDVLSVFN